MHTDDSKVQSKIEELYLQYPFYGYRRITKSIQRDGILVNHKKVQRLMKEMNIKAVYPKINLSKPNKAHKKYPYLLKGINISRINQVWGADITYINLSSGRMYLVIVVDMYSRKILSWKVSNTLDRFFCIEALQEAISKYGYPEIFNTDQGSQFTSNEFTEILNSNQINISMNGKGRALDNIFVERTFRSVKYEEIYLNEYENMRKCRNALEYYFNFFNNKRLHQSLKYKTPNEVYFEYLELKNVS